MNTPTPITRYKKHRFLAKIFSHAAWLYFRFCPSYCDVEELLCSRGVTLSYEAMRKWCRKFGQRYANQLSSRRPRPGDKGYLDEVFLTINKERHYLRRGVDQDGKESSAAGRGGAMCLWTCLIACQHGVARLHMGVVWGRQPPLSRHRFPHAAKLRQSNM